MVVTTLVNVNGGEVPVDFQRGGSWGTWNLDGTDTDAGDPLCLNSYDLTIVATNKTLICHFDGGNSTPMVKSSGHLSGRSSKSQTTRWMRTLAMEGKKPITIMTLTM